MTRPVLRSSARAAGRGVLAVLAWSAAFAWSACTPVPIVSYDAAATDAEAGAFSAMYALDGGDAEAGVPWRRKEWDAGVDDDAFPSADRELDLRMRHLLEALAAGDPALAPDVLYPRDAWVRSRDASDPGKAWDHKTKPAFLRDVTKLHKRVKGMPRARFVSFELGNSVSHSPVKARDLKRPVWRVKRSRLTYTIDDKPKHLTIAEMTAFRGAWYVTRLR